MGSRIFFAVLFLASVAGAQIRLTAEFGDDAPTTSFSAPDEVLVLTFDVTEPIDPTISSDNQWDLESPVSYTLGGAVVPVPVSDQTFWLSPANGGGLTIVIENALDGIRLDFNGPQLFSGPTNSPVLTLPSSFVPSASQWDRFNLANGSPIASGVFSDALFTASAALGANLPVSNAVSPEPDSFQLLALGGVLLAARVALRRFLRSAGAGTLPQGR